MKRCKYSGTRLQASTGIRPLSVSDLYFLASDFFLSISRIGVGRVKIISH